MDECLKILNSEVSLEEYFEAENVSDEVRGKMDSVDALIIPMKHSENEFYFAKDTIDFVKFCRQNDTEHTYDVLAEGDIKVLSLHSFDIWLPIIQVTIEFLPSIIKAIHSYIKFRLKGREKEDANVDVTMVVKRKNEKKTLHYYGDAKTFKETFEKIDLNKM